MDALSDFIQKLRSLHNSRLWQNSTIAQRSIIITIFSMADKDGSVLTSYREIALKAGVSRGAVEKALRRLTDDSSDDSSDDKLMTKRRQGKYTLIHIKDWSYYNESSTPMMKRRQSEDSSDDSNGDTGRRTKGGELGDNTPGVKRIQTPYRKIKEAWNKFAEKQGCSQIRKITKKRRRWTKRRWREWHEHSTEDDPWAVFREVLRESLNQSFLWGENDRDWVMNFDFLMRNSNHWVRVLEHAYSDPENGERDGELLF